jgi:hypothetical protein
MHYLKTLFFKVVKISMNQISALFYNFCRGKNMGQNFLSDPSRLNILNYDNEQGIFLLLSSRTLLVSLIYLIVVIFFNLYTDN